LTLLLVGLLGTLQVEVMSRLTPRVVEIFQGDGWIAIRAGAGQRREFREPRLRLPGKQERSYPGLLTIETREGRLRLVNHLSEDEYLMGVLAAEAETEYASALEALAIAARSMIPFLRGRHQGVDVCDLTHCQAYVGLASSPAIARAVQATAGRRLSYQGRPALAPYHSTCGGATASSRGLFALRPTYLRGIDDQGLCRRSPHFRWETRLRPEQIERIVESKAPVRRLELRSLASGEVELVVNETERLSAEAFYRRAGRQLGWHIVKSPRFTVEREGGRFLLRGQGLGHRVGLCQWGAEAMARLGKSADEILEFYFPGCTVSS
jgi:stage II sporulation protein D